jgi:hypothetical protein
MGFKKTKINFFREYRINEILVEAAGVEPASENVTGQETTCLFAFMPQALVAIAGDSPGTFAAHAQNGQETLAASL